MAQTSIFSWCLGLMVSIVIKHSPSQGRHVFLLILFMNKNLEHTPIEPRKKKQRPYFPSNPACLIRILIMGFQNPHIPGYYNPLYTQNNQGHYFCAQLDYSVVNIPHGAAFLSPIIGPTFIQKTKREFLRNPGIPIINNLPSLKPTWHLKKHPLEKEIPIGNHHFWVLC